MQQINPLCPVDATALGKNKDFLNLSYMHLSTL